MPLNDVLRHGTHALAGSLNSHRILLYSIVSLFAVSLTIANALRNYSNFYSVAISLSKSNRSVLALANFGFLVSLLCGHIIQRIFFGTLRANEVERLYDRLWFFITESLLAFTIFRDEFDIPFAMMFGFLLFVKSFHWLASDRIEWMDQRPYPGPSPVFHLRMTVLFLFLWLTDLFMFLIAVENTIANGVGGMVLFASEYGILMASVLNTISKYLLSAYELRRAGRRGGENAPPWENKSMWTFYIELATDPDVNARWLDFLKLTTYLVFFMIIITFYGLPLNIVRDVYITARSFVTRLRALHRYQTATRNMDQRYPNATADELTAMSDHTCIICREEMISHEARMQGQEQEQTPTMPSDGPNTTPKKLPCGHIFHFHCLRSWLERQQSCPTCRRTVLDTNPQGQNAIAPAAVGEPRRPNPPPGPGQNQNRVNPLGNPLGLVGRLFGPPAQAPIGPGQVLPGQQVPQIPNNPAQNTGIPAGQQPPQGVVIQYHIQYQLPRNQQQNPQQPLQPPPQFPGFQAPGGAWQPWPLDVAAEEPGNTNATDDTQTQQTPPPAPTPTTREGEDAPVTPREAAALAALRRVPGNGSNHSTPASSSTQPSTKSQPSSSTSPAASSSTAAAPSQRSSANLHNAPNVPALIPLYDYSEINSGPTVGTVANGGSTFASSEPHVRVPLGQPGNSRTAPRTAPRSHNVQRNAASLLPPTLTDEQLANMDRLTREAIDERLRVLEGVSSAVYRCIDDLMRMRSALPSPNPIVPGQRGPSVPATTPDISTTEGASTSSSPKEPQRGTSPTSSDSSDWVTPQTSDSTNAPESGGSEVN
ncbi:hypothetical protein DXG01_010188 [Tephrocybe rancida]|nr:hypothetical protein DXG01_010188 [Tephrocybe rancida]